MPILQKGEADDSRMLVTELFGNRMVRKGRWKATRIFPPLGRGEWELFDIVADPSARRNLSAEYPGLLAEMIEAYDRFAIENGVIAPDPRPRIKSNVGYEGTCDWWCATKFGFVDIMFNPVQRRLLFAAILGLPVLGGIAWFYRRRKRQIAE